ncbi:helix-turn-helix protein [Bradyrhizobium macuxiense]|uniref:Helix-turn-helix protein n=1 Tax=Bradyrhizobium macuxiense TaxID=1755647 RepID=A0A560L4P7_9BRAD|nr:XRE family transcriptional regulator [Bradyrhizobium macuxiense]TWB89414.1 helix-turn-helix protein [Bradyrhizobium macuxiense]
MPLTQQELGRRLRDAREAVSFTQDQVADHLGVSRSAIAQIELGNRAVGSLELDQLARLYGRDIREFFSEDFRQETALVAFRLAEALADENAADALRDCMSVSRELTHLEKLVGANRDLASMVRYGVPSPRSRYDAIRQGSSVAEQERRRLAIGDAPIEDINELLQAQGVRTAMVSLPEDVSGLTLLDPDIGPFVAVNCEEHILRRTFSFAHEYAHVLLDSDVKGTISRNSQNTELMEVRANSFAANFLMPEGGVREFLGTLGKGGQARLFAETPTGDDSAIGIEARGTGSQEVRLHDVVLLAHRFGVSRTVALYRLRNLHILSDRELQVLLAQEREGRGRELERLMRLPKPAHDEERYRFHYRFLSLALEAYEREAISRSKVEELFAAVLKQPKSAISLDEFQLIEREKPTGVSIPGG